MVLGIPRCVGARRGDRCRRHESADRRFDAREPPCADRRQHRGAIRGAFTRVRRRDLRAEDVGEDLPPERAGDPAARRPDLGGCGHAGLDHELEPIAQAERDALEDGPRHVSAIVRKRQAHERTTRARIGMRAALPGQVGQETQSLTSSRHTGRNLDEVRELDPWRHRIAEPAQAPGGREHDRHHVPALGHRVAERVDPAVRLIERPIGRREHNARRPERQRNRARRHRADANGVGRLVAAAGDHRRARPQAGHPRGDRVHVPGDRRSLVRWREPRRIELEALEDLPGPVARREVEQDRPRSIRLVQRIVLGQLEADEVLRQHHVGNARPDVRFVIADPEQLRGGEAGERIVARDRDQSLRAHRRANGVALGRGALVVPEDRRPKRPPVPIE